MNKAPTTAQTRRAREYFLNAFHYRRPDFEFSSDQQQALNDLSKFLANVTDALDMAAAYAAKHGFEQMYNLMKPYLDEKPASSESVVIFVFSSFLETLNIQLYTFMCQLTVFADGWTAELAGNIFSLPCAFEWCEELCKLSLITKTGGSDSSRYTMQTALKTYLETTISADKKEIWTSLFVRYFAELARQAAPHLRYSLSFTWIQRLNIETENIYAAIDCADGEQCVEMVCHLWRWALERGDFARMQNAIVRAQLICFDISVYREVEINRALGVFHGRQAKREIGLSYLHYALQIAEENGIKQTIPFLMDHIGIILRQSGQYEESLSLHLRSYAIWKREDNQLGMAMACISLGVLYWVQGRLAESYNVLLEGANICRSINDPVLGAKILSNMSAVAEIQGRYKIAITGYLRALSCYNQTDNAHEKVTTLNNIAVTYFRCKEYRRSRKYFESAISLCSEHNFTNYVPNIIAGMAEAVYKSGNPRQAAILFGAYIGHEKQACVKLSADATLEIETHIKEVGREMREEMFNGLIGRGASMTLQEVVNLFRRELKRKENITCP